MKSFSKLISEVAQPKAGDEIDFKKKHIDNTEFWGDPNTFDSQHTGDTRNPYIGKKIKRIADYDNGEDEDVYESEIHENQDENDDGVIDPEDSAIKRAKALEKKRKFYEGMDPVSKKAALGNFDDREDKDIDNDGDVDSSDKYLHKRRKAVTKAVQKVKESMELLEKAKSEAQQKAAAIALQVKRGNLPKSALIGASKEMYNMSEKDLEDFAKTKHKGIPAKVEESYSTWNAQHPTKSGKKYTVKARNTGEAINKAHKAAIKAGHLSPNTSDSIWKPKHTNKVNEAKETLSEAFKAGNLKLRDGSSVDVSSQDAKLLNQLFKDLNPKNKKEMQKVAMTDEAGFEEILGFAREAL